VSRLRILAGVAAILLVVASGTGYLGWRLTSATGEAAAGLDLSRTASILYVESGSSRVRQVPMTGGPAFGAGAVCQRVAAGGGTLACLRATAVPMASELEISPAAGEGRTLQLWGNPSRVRVSASGALVGWTVFRTGDTYLVPGAFATTAGIFDLRTGAHHGSLEDFTAYLDGKPYAAVDRNFWGVTFAPDDRTFYATMATAGKTWLMRGDLSAGRMTAIRQNVECPSVSPDGTRIAYKFRTGKNWRLHVLDLTSGHDVALAEPDHVDDQPAWLDGQTVAYGKKGAVYAVPADGSGIPHHLVDGSSPSLP
jgi:hypothetical protein